MSVMAGFVILVAEGMAKMWNRMHAIPFGVYGATKVGKTTLHHQLRTRGEVPEIKNRTVGLERVENMLNWMEMHTQLKQQMWEVKRYFGLNGLMI